MNIKKLQLVYFSVFAIPVILAALYYTGVLGKRENNWSEMTLFITTFALDLVTIGIIYLGVKLMKFKFVYSSIISHPENTLRPYIGWNILRYSAYLIVILASLYIYMHTSNDSGLYTTAMTLIGHIFCYPSEQECNYILETYKTQEK